MFSQIWLVSLVAVTLSPSVPELTNFIPLAQMLNAAVYLCKCCFDLSFVELALMQTHRSAPFKRTMARPHVLVLVKGRASEDWLCNIPVGEKEMTGFCFINTGFMRNMLHMDIRQGAVVLQRTSGLKLQWQFPPRITSHRFQLPLRWYASVPLIRYTFMFSATKHLVSQRDAHLSVWETTGPLAAWRNASRASSPPVLIKLSEQPHLRGLSMHPREVMARTGSGGAGSSFWL